MPWLWTDDLARLIDEHDGTEAAEMAAWIARPTAHAVEHGVDAFAFARDLLAAERAQHADALAEAV